MPGGYKDWPHSPCGGIYFRKSEKHGTELLGTGARAGCYRQIISSATPGRPSRDALGIWINVARLAARRRTSQDTDISTTGGWVPPSGSNSVGPADLYVGEIYGRSV